LEDEEVGPELLGKFDIRSPSEGTKREVTLPVKNTRLKVIINILYDDNMAYYAEWFHDAINITLRVSEVEKPTLAQSLTVTSGEVGFSKDFKQTSFGTLLRQGRSWYDFWITCRLKD